MLANSIIASFVNDISSMYSLVSFVLLVVAFKLFRPNNKGWLGKATVKGWLGEATVKGWLGEAEVKGALAQLPADHYHVLHDVLLPCSDGETTQIDHVVIGRSAIYVIETKNFGGAVYGQEKDPYWTVVYSFWSKYRFQNPLHQNYRHIQAIQEVVGNDFPVHNLVVFVRGTFPEGKPDRVLSLVEIARYIHATEKNSQARDGIASHALGLIQDALITDLQARKHHIQRLKLRNDGQVITPMSAPMSAKVLVVLAVAVFVFGAVHTKTRKAVASHAKNGSGARAAHRTLPRSVPSVRIPQSDGMKHNVGPIQILGSGDGVASVQENGNVYTLHNGEATPLGWKLVMATPKGVFMIRPDGKPFHMDW